jgi:NAD(P)-dependent dehydrogenase (short-subunit alcohol dehydrogenase family)
VVAVSRTPADLESLAAEIGCRTVAADLADAGQAVAAATEAVRLAGRIDCLVNNAGISIPQPLLETTAEAFDQTMAVNVRAALLVTQVVARDMIARKQGGSVVNLSSQASMAALADHAAYCAARAGWTC